MLFLLWLRNSSALDSLTFLLDPPGTLSFLCGLLLAHLVSGPFIARQDGLYASTGGATDDLAASAGLLIVTLDHLDVFFLVFSELWCSGFTLALHDRRKCLLKRALLHGCPPGRGFIEGEFT